MEPLLPDGSTVGVDLSQRSIVDGKVYVIDHGGMLRIKLLYRLPSGVIRLRSYNSEEHPEERYSPEDSVCVKVIGRVFWSSIMY